MNKPWKLIVLLAGIFLAGSGTGAFLTRCMCKPAPQPIVNRPPPSAELWSSLHLKRMKSDAGLEDSQLAVVKPIVDRRMEELFQMRARYLDENRALRMQMEREVAEKLTPVQREKYAEMNRIFHERARKMERGEQVPPLKDP